jgi:non-homologous end joining protein Ku
MGPDFESRSAFEFASMPPPSLWSGNLRLSLVLILVKLCPAVSTEAAMSFRMIHEPPKSRRERKTAMTNQTATRELAAAQRRVMRAWTRLEQKRDDIIKSLRAVEGDMAAIQPVLNANPRQGSSLDAALALDGSGQGRGRV